LKDDTYFAKVILELGAPKLGKDEVAIDARPSDAITVALKAQAPMYVAERVMNAVAPRPEAS
jgi:bifunctional DNase/RNase